MSRDKRYLRQNIPTQLPCVPLTANAMCMYPEGLCTDGKSIKFITSDESILNIPEAEFPLHHQHHYHYAFYHSYTSHAASNFPVLQPSLQSGHDMKFVKEHWLPEDSIHWVETLIVNAGPMGVTNTFLFTWKPFFGPLVTLMRYYLQIMISSIPERSNRRRHRHSL